MSATLNIKTTGKILVSEGENVSEGKILACEEYIPQLVSVNISKSLSISPKFCKKFLLKDLGKEIKSSEVIAKKKGLFGLKKKILKAPCDGILERLEVETGELIISLPREKKEIRSAVFGKVKKVNQGELIISVVGEEISLKKTIGSFIKGELVIIPGEKIDLFSISQEVNRKIVVGKVWNQAVLEKALAIGVAAIIASETPDFDWQVMEKGKKLTVGKIEEKIILNLGLIDKNDFRILEKNRGKTAIFDPKDKKLIILQ